MIVFMNEQECYDQFYEFYGVPSYCTPGFIKAFGKDFTRIAFISLMMISERYPEKNWDYLQTFSYNNIDFWIISEVIQGEQITDEHITFLLPSEY